MFDSYAKLLSLIAIAVLVSCGTADLSPEKVDDVSFALKQHPTLRARCIEKQQARLEACASAPEEQQGLCRAGANALKEACSDLPDVTLEAGASQNTGFCEGECDTVECSVAEPCELGEDLDGDGSDDSCVTGERCAPDLEGEVCDEGVIFDCYCTTFYFPRNAIRALDECRCYCD